MGYATGQFGKNHVGDRNDTLPTVNGFDEFFGNLYHLNAEEEPELPTTPRTRHTWPSSDRAASCTPGPPTSTTKPSIPASARSASSASRIPGALNKKRMETIDDETSAAAIDFMRRQQEAGQPFFVWFNSTRMHLRTHVRPEHRGRYTTATASTSTA